METVFCIFTNQTEIYMQMSDYSNEEERLSQRKQPLWNPSWGAIHSNVKSTPHIGRHIVPSYKEKFHIHLRGVFANDDSVKDIGDWVRPGASFNIAM